MNRNKEYEAEREDSLRQLSQLKIENEELARSLHEVNEKLRNSEQLKGHFISNITNEIVNPFTSILALAGNIKQLNPGEISKAHHMAGLIFEEAFHLDFQLKNIFAAALIEAGKDEIQCAVVDLVEFSDQIAQYFKPLLDKKQIQLLYCFSGKEPLLFTTDREKLELIVKNLVSNSIKYSPENSIVEVNFKFGEASLLLEVSDHGKGIQPEDRRIIFDRFKQLDEKINSINTGHGLGLSIVQAYTEMLGGTVTLSNNVDGGVKVSVSISEGVEGDKWNDLDSFIFDSEASF